MNTQGPLDVDAIRKRCEAAASGPWGPIVKNKSTQVENFSVVLHGHGQAALSIGYIACPDDAEFIAHAREDIPALLAEIERLRAALRAPTVEPGRETAEEDAGALRPCPHCGSDRVHVYLDDSADRSKYWEWRHECIPCGEMIHETEAEAIAAWNNRASQPDSAIPINHATP